MAGATSMGDVTYPNTNGASMNDVLSKGPVVDNIKSEATRTHDELRDLRNAQVPSTTTSTGQHLTRYHSLLYSLLSWEQPRATAVSYLSVISFIFAARFLPLLRWVFKFVYLSLGLTLAAEIAGRVVLSQGLAGSFRPRKYFTIPRETLEASLEDIQQLLDFFLIEFQRVLFAENIVHTVAAFSAAFIAYWLIRFLPFWGLSFIAANIAYLGPLVYMNNREVIDAHIENAESIIIKQANQLKDLAEEQTSHATGLMKQYMDEYSVKAQQYVNPRSVSPEMSKVPAPTQVKTETTPQIKTMDFPEAPKDEPVSVPVAEQTKPQEPIQEPLLA
ncbi:hypothetical protein PHISCL_00922 [Aspergillus sclerotialis]|uniref:Reticulon-like protein n=1 Tax=Aspergillus sclerotialis TaxID=2070753 RepID=A0A3A3ABC7_9EURO|nr:hypothetical protein PHISCL_00922 [Aspergillus sclerotialis]